MKTALNIGLAILLCAALGIATLLYWNIKQLQTPLWRTSSVIYEIPQGMTLSTLEADLLDKKLLPYPYLYKFASRVMGMDAPILAGEYEITPGMSPQAMLELFQKGANYQRFIMIPEGLTSYQIVQQLREEDDLSGEIDEVPPEGALLPETYSYTKGENRNMLLKRMENALNKTLDEAWENRAENLPLKTKEEALVLASIIEKETAVPDERQRVAGVFTNRLRKGMKLQTDPTVIYALTLGAHKDAGSGPLGRRLLRKDLKVDSPYNTYLYEGLPPTPIANAGRAAIEAAVHPETNAYLFFVADGSGGHSFAKTLAEHNSNVAKWKMIRNLNE
jgi:UPF0755 protein